MKWYVKIIHCTFYDVLMMLGMLGWRLLHHSPAADARAKGP